MEGVYCRVQSGRQGAGHRTGRQVRLGRDTIDLLSCVLIFLIAQIILNRGTSPLPLLHETAQRSIGLDHDNSLAGSREVTDESGPHPGRRCGILWAAHLLQIPSSLSNADQ